MPAVEQITFLDVSDEFQIVRIKELKITISSGDILDNE
jgi:hypothetical protein